MDIRGMDESVRYYSPRRLLYPDSLSEGNGAGLPDSETVGR
jgi:hypothetical protein